ncbi:MAG: hypothetical protein ACRD0S_07470 [Acidimicrobiales bacterium]
MAAAGALAVIAASVWPRGAEANHQPADKVVAAASKLEEISPREEVTLLTSTLRTSAPTDLILSVSMECSIFTGLVTGPSSDGGTDSAMASGHVRAWVEIDGKIAPINSVSTSTLVATSAGNDSDKVTFCSRTYQRTVTDNENPLDGQDIEDDYIDTKSANAFNWLRLNMGPGSHTILVKGTLSQATSGDASASAVVGNRSLIVQPAKLANDASI